MNAHRQGTIMINGNISRKRKLRACFDGDCGCSVGCFASLVTSQVIRSQHSYGRVVICVCADVGVCWVFDARVGEAFKDICGFC